MFELKVQEQTPQIYKILPHVCYTDFLATPTNITHFITPFINKIK